MRRLSNFYFFSAGADFSIKVSMNHVAKVLGWQGVVRGEAPGAVQRSPGPLGSFVGSVFKAHKADRKSIENTHT